MRRAPVFIGDAGPKGKGVYAGAPMRRSTRVGSFRGKPRWIWDIPEAVWPYAVQVDYDKYVVPRKGGIVWYINHSCEPNCVISGDSIRTARDVERGEELTFDYSTDVDWPGFTMKCSCGSRSCRGVVRAYRFLPPALRLRYGSKVAPFILREYPRKRGAARSGPAAPAGRRAAPRSP